MKRRGRTFTAEEKKYFKSQIRDMLALDERVTADVIAKRLNISNSAALRYRNEVIDQEINTLKDSSVAQNHIAMVKLRHELLRRSLFNISSRQTKYATDEKGELKLGKDGKPIILEKGSSDFIKLSAYKIIAQNDDKLSNLFLNSGVVPKVAEQVQVSFNTLDVTKLVEKILNAVDESTKNIIISTVDEYLREFIGAKETSMEE